MISSVDAETVPAVGVIIVNFNADGLLLEAVRSVIEPVAAATPHRGRRQCEHRRVTGRTRLVVSRRDARAARPERRLRGGEQHRDRHARRLRVRRPAQSRRGRRPGVARVARRRSPGASASSPHSRAGSSARTGRASSIPPATSTTCTARPGPAVTGHRSLRRRLRRRCSARRALRPSTAGSGSFGPDRSTRDSSATSRTSISTSACRASVAGACTCRKRTFAMSAGPAAAACRRSRSTTRSATSSGRT